MRLPGRRQYPKQVAIADEVYAVRFVRSFKEKNTMGECCGAEREIRIKLGMTRQETLQTYIHETLHALEFECKVKLPHRLVYKLEVILFDYFMANF